MAERRHFTRILLFDRRQAHPGVNTSGAPSWSMSPCRERPAAQTRGLGRQRGQGVRNLLRARGSDIEIKMQVELTHEGQQEAGVLLPPHRHRQRHSPQADDRAEHRRNNCSIASWSSCCKSTRPRPRILSGRAENKGAPRSFFISRLQGPRGIGGVSSPAPPPSPRWDVLGHWHAGRWLGGNRAWPPPAVAPDPGHGPYLAGAPPRQRPPDPWAGA